MEKALQVFIYNGESIRTINIDGEPYFVGKDIATVLGYQRTADAVTAHVDEEDRLTRCFTESGQRREMTVINESGMYALIFASKLPEAKKFKHWVTHEVLPQIRQHGMYLTDQVAEIAKADPTAFEQLLEKYVAECKKTQVLELKLASEQAFTNLGHVVLALPGSITVQAAAHFLSQFGFDTGQNRLYKKCRDKGLLGKRKGKQYNQPTQRAIERGLFNAEISGGFRPIAMVTPKGLSYLTEMFADEDYPLLVLIEEIKGETEQQ